MRLSTPSLIHTLPKPGNNPRLFLLHSKAAPIGAARSEKREINHDNLPWSCRLDLNQRPADYKSAALPAEATAACCRSFPAVITGVMKKKDSVPQDPQQTLVGMEFAILYAIILHHVPFPCPFPFSFCTA